MIQVKIEKERKKMNIKEKERHNDTA